MLGGLEGGKRRSLREVTAKFSGTKRNRGMLGDPREDLRELCGEATVLPSP